VKSKSIFVLIFEAKIIIKLDQVSIKTTGEEINSKLEFETRVTPFIK